MTSILIPAEPYSTQLLYTTYNVCGEMRRSHRSKFAYYTRLIGGISLGITVGIIEYAAEKALQYFRKPFLIRNNFDIGEWKSQCRTWQIEAAIQTVGELIFDEFDPMSIPFHSLLLKDMNYLQSVRTTTQWVNMDEDSPTIKELGRQLTLKMNSGYTTIMEWYKKETIHLDRKNRHVNTFIVDLTNHSQRLKRISDITKPLLLS